MFWEIFLFEIKYRLRHVSTYVYFAIWFVMTLLSVSANDFGPIGVGRVLRNGPFALTEYYLQLTSFGIIIISAIFGTSILRDFQRDTYQLIFTKPISKFAYLGGRLAGSIVISIFIFSGLVFGALLGPFMPWIDKTRVGPINLWFHLQPFLLLTVVQIFFLGCLFFFVAALTRQIMVVYLQGVVIFCIYLIGAIYVFNQRNLNTFWPAVLDPLGLVLSDHVTRYWTVVEKNSKLWTLSGAILYNRLLWCAVGLLSLASTLLFFPMSAEELTRKGTARKAAKQRAQEGLEQKPEVLPLVSALPRTRQIFDSVATLSQFRSLVRLRFLNVVREIPFWALCLVILILAFINGRAAGHFRDNNVWPVTYLILQMVTANGVLWYAIATLYVGELVWRERDVHFDQIHDSLPVPTWVDWLAKLIGMAGAEILLFAMLALCGIAVQISLGYYHFELLHYFKEIFLIAFFQLIAFTLYAFFWQTILPNKFLGHALVIGTILLVPILYQYGFENRLYLLLETTPFTYSDMNGYGHFVAALFWSLCYWLAFAGLLGVISIAFTRRGTDLSWAARLRDARLRLPGLFPAFVACAVVCLGSGIWFYYNTHVLNEFRTARDQRKLQAEYERKYKKYERIVQPKIVAVDTNVDLFPERRSFSATGHFTLVNRSSQPMTDIHVVSGRESVNAVSFDRPSQCVLMDRRLWYSIYRLQTPLKPGEQMRMDFHASYTSHGFRDGNEREEFAYNGTFFDRDYFPVIGYDRGIELNSPVRRREEKLPPLEEMAAPGDPYYRNVNLFTPDSGWITFHTVVSTSPDQIAIAPGYLKREWSQNGRCYFEYDMGSTRINDFYSYVSARYAVKRDKWNDVNLEIYYQPGHEYNLARMLDASKKGLAYFTTNFGPYQFKQFRILEFPRYRQFAQSFPNTVPYSEALGFIQRVEKPDDIDMVFYITAHELAHQWWGHQLIGSATQGSNMMSETLAQYSALMVMEKEYGPYQMQRFLKHELDGYLRGRGSETRREPPLALVQREPYVWYQKGSLVMYALRDYIGEERLNQALRKFLEQNKFAQGPFPDTLGFEACLREAAPPDMRYLISDMFDSITLFDNKAVSAKATPLGANRYKVELTVTAHKKKADGAGSESEVPINDLIDIGVLSRDDNGRKPLYLEKKHLSHTTEHFEIVVTGKPYKAGIDPYNKLIDRNPEDNTVPVSM
ncbi:MAG: hypothetical protein JO061_12415 [Acidobacteriaceae bacterium]|nr:hypothetical protein [Acidobacteriaceae bacterium]